MSIFLCVARICCYKLTQIKCPADIDFHKSIMLNILLGHNVIANIGKVFLYLIYIPYYYYYYSYYYYYYYYYYYWVNKNKEGLEIL